MVLFNFAFFEVLGIGEEVRELETEKERFIHTVDFVAQQQTELEAVVVEMEKSLGLDDWTAMTPIGLPDAAVATQADMQRQAMLVI